MALPINPRIMKSPANWFIVFLMLIFASLIAEMIGVWLGGPNGCGCNKS